MLNEMKDRLDFISITTKSGGFDAPDREGREKEIRPIRTDSPAQSTAGNINQRWHFWKNDT
jgi:hypothetical protein